MIPKPTDIVAQPERFLMQLKQRDDRAGSSRILKTVQQGWKVASAAKVGATAAGSTVVANTLFAHTATGGVLAWIGLGTAAATPAGWIAAAAFAAGAGYYGVTRLASDGRPVATVPLTLETGMDALAVRLFDLIGALAIRVAAIDGVIDPEERATIHRQFVDKWGYASGFIGLKLDRLVAASDAITVTGVARCLAEYQAVNPDCNADAMQSELVQFLREVVSADGRLDEREMLALDAIERTLARERGLVRTAERKVAGWRERAERAAVRLRDRFSGRGDPAA